MSDAGRCDRCAHAFAPLEHSHLLAWTGEEVCCRCFLGDLLSAPCAIRSQQAQDAGVTDAARLLRIAWGAEDLPADMSEAEHDALGP